MTWPQWQNNCTIGPKSVVSTYIPIPMEIFHQRSRNVAVPLLVLHHFLIFFHSCRQLFSFCSLGEGGERLPNIFHCIQNFCNSQNTCLFPSATPSLTTWVTDKIYLISHHSCTCIHFLLPNQQTKQSHRSLSQVMDCWLNSLPSEKFCVIERVPTVPFLAGVPKF